MLFYVAIFCFIALFGAVYRYELNSRSRWLYYALLLLLILMAGFRAEGVDNDMQSYLTAMRQGWGIAEPSFFFISYIGYDLLGSSRWVFLIYAFLALTLRFTAYRKLSDYFFLTVAIYFVQLFVTHEMNQIRSAVSFGFMLWAMYYWLSSPRKKAKAFMMMGGALLFHFSFITAWLVMFFVTNSRRRLNWYLCLIPLAYVLHFAGLSPLVLLSRLGGSYIASKIAFYQSYGMDVVQTVNVFSILVVIKIGLIALLYYGRDILVQKIPYFYYYLKLYIIGLFFLLFFSSIPAAAFRMSDVFWVVEPLLLPGLIFLFQPRWAGTVVLLTLCGYWLYLNYFTANFIRPYAFDFSL